MYDRAGSSFSTLRPGMIDWETVFADAGWFHWSGVAAALSQSGADTCLEALQTADRMGLTISCDLNFRKKLWNYGSSAAEVMQPLVQYIRHFSCRFQGDKYGLPTRFAGI